MKPQTVSEIEGENQIEPLQLPVDEKIEEIADFRLLPALSREQKPVFDVAVKDELIVGAADIKRTNFVGPIGHGRNVEEIGFRSIDWALTSAPPLMSERPLPSLTKLLNDSPDDLVTILKGERPSLLRQIESDAATSNLFEAWSLSSNIDAGTKKPTVKPQLLKRLGELAGQPVDDENQIANAGMLHTYGYLLSNVRTSFGFKRARWTQGAMERGLDLPKGHLSPIPKTGTLLSNLTEVFRAPKTGGLTLTETLTEPGVKLMTTVVDFVPKAKPTDGKGDSAALFYSCQVKDELRFVTAFPVGGWMIGKIRKSARRTQSDAIQSRYNAVIPELQGRAWPGTIELTELA